MKSFAFLFVALTLISFSQPWQTNFDLAQQEARQKHKSILLYFSGSDWCGPCVRLHREIFDVSSFQQFADSNLVLVNADFPRQKKNQLPKSLQHDNEVLAEKYNKNGAFPLTLLLDVDGKVLKTWEGFPDESPDAFVKEIETSLHAINQK